MYPCHQAMWMIRPGKVLHKDLQDFTVGHAYLLEAMESPFMLGGKIGLTDLVVAVLICSMPFDKARRYLMRDIRKIERDVSWWGWWCGIRGFDFGAECDAMNEYILAYHDMPDAYRKRGQKKYKSALPEAVRVAWCLMERMTEQEAWNCPMSRALGYYVAEAERNGQEFVTEAEYKKVTDGNG